MTKEEYRKYFGRFSKYVRIATVSKDAKLQMYQPNFSSFMAGNDSAANIETLEQLKKECESIAELMSRNKRKG